MADEYCSQSFRDAMYWYAVNVHAYPCIVVCLLGSVSSVLSIVVLNRKGMASPTGTLLTGLALSDILVMLSYVPYAAVILLATQHDHPPYTDTFFSYHWAWYRLLHDMFYKVVHAISIWLTLTLAVWRYLVVCWPHRSKSWCNGRRAAWSVVAGYVLVPILCVPNYLLYEVVGKETANGTTPGTIKYDFLLTPLAYNRTTKESTPFFQVNFWVIGVIVRLVPCIALTILSLRLVWALVQARRRRRYLMDNRSCSVKQVNKSSSHRSSTDRQMERTTRMVMAVLLFFLLTELPHGLAALLAALDSRFYFQCYLNLQEILDTLLLVNCAINFALYCVMSKAFRQTFKDVFIPKLCRHQTQMMTNSQSSITTCTSQV